MPYTIDIDSIVLTICSLELNQIELIFNIIIQYFTPAYKNNRNINYKMITLLYDVIKLILLNIVFHIIISVVIIIFN